MIPVGGKRGWPPQMEERTRAKNLTMNSVDWARLNYLR